MSGPTRDLVLAGEPRVQLLPPTVRAREKAREARRVMALLIVVAVVVVAGMTGFGFYRAADAQAQLTAVQTTTQEIVAQQAKFKQGTSVSALVGQIQQAQAVGTSLEIMWSPLFDQIRSGLPAGSVLASATVKSQAPWETALVPEGPLRTPRLAVVTIVISGPSTPDAVAVTSTLRQIKGYADSTVQTTATQNGSVSTTISLTLDSGALSDRYASPKSGAPSTKTGASTDNNAQAAAGADQGAGK